MRVQQRVTRLRRLKGFGTDGKKDASLTKKKMEISSPGKGITLVLSFLYKFGLLDNWNCD